MLAALLAAISISPEFQGRELVGVRYNLEISVSRLAILQAGFHRRVEHRVPCSPDAAELSVKVRF